MGANLCKSPRGHRLAGGTPTSKVHRGSPSEFTVMEMMMEMLMEMHLKFTRELGLGAPIRLHKGSLSEFRTIKTIMQLQLKFTQEAI